jgi:hypothetical protein
VDYKPVDIKWLATELEGKSCEVLGDEKLTEMIEAFRKIVGGSEKSSLGSLESLPGWFLVKALEQAWPDVTHKDVFIYQLNSQLGKTNYRELKIQIAAKISIIDPTSGMDLLERMDDKNLRKKGTLPKNYIDFILKYFAGEDSRPIVAIFQHSSQNTRILKNVALQLFEAFFGGKSTFPLANKCALQGQLLHWLIIHKQYLACIEAFPNAITNELLMWPINMLTEYEAIRNAADAAGVPFGTLGALLPKALPTEEEIASNKQKVLQKTLDTELLDEFGKRLSSYREQVESKVAKLNEQSGKIFELQAQKNSVSQKLAALEGEKRDLITQRESMKARHAQETRTFEEEIGKLKEQVATKDNNISALNMEIDSLKSDFAAQIDKMARRIGVESERSKREMVEKIQDSLFQEFKNMNQLGDSESHKVAKIMLAHVFDKLSRLGVTFSK